MYVPTYIVGEEDEVQRDKKERARERVCERKIKRERWHKQKSEEIIENANAAAMLKNNLCNNFFKL